VGERTEYRVRNYHDGRPDDRLMFVDGKLQRRDLGRVLNFEEDRMIHAGILQFFYLRLSGGRGERDLRRRSGSSGVHRSRVQATASPSILAHARPGTHDRLPHDK
jgi:hypothetical protein